jgi:hypothetical protein
MAKSLDGNIMRMRIVLIPTTAYVVIMPARVG